MTYDVAHQHLSLSYNGVASTTASDQDLKSKELLVSEFLDIVKSRPAGNRLVVLRGIHGKQQGPLWLTPAKDALSERLLGVEVLTDEEKRNHPRPVEPETTRKIVDGFSFNLETRKDKNNNTIDSNKVDMVDVEWVLRCPEICTSLEEAQRTKDACYYIEDLTAEINNKVSLRKKKFEAGTKLDGLSQEEKVDLARLLGYEVKSWKPIDVEELLTEKCETDPLKILAALDDKSRETRLFLMKLQDKKVIREFDGVHFYGDIPLGTTPTQVVSWLQDANNASKVSLMYATLYGHENNSKNHDGDARLRNIALEFQNRSGNAKISDNEISDSQIMEQALNRQREPQVNYQQGDDDSDIPDNPYSALENLNQAVTSIGSEFQPGAAPSVTEIPGEKKPRKPSK